jgi:DNA-binding XRE family transcriptional regulator
MSVPNEYALPPLTEAPRLEPSMASPSSAATWGVLLESITGTGRSRLKTLCAFTTLAMTGVAVIQHVSDSSESATPVAGEPPALVSARASLPRVEGAAKELSLVSELRALTGLNVVQIARMLGVTRATVYAWERGTLPRGEREAHVLEALSFARGAARQFPEARALKQWLMTPAAPELETPLQLMAQRRWRPLRGLLVQARAGDSALRAPRPLEGSARPLEHAELRQALRSLSPPTSREDLESEETTGEPPVEA